MTALEELTTELRRTNALLVLMDARLARIERGFSNRAPFESMRSDPSLVVVRPNTGWGSLPRRSRTLSDVIGIPEDEGSR